MFCEVNVAQNTFPISSSMKSFNRSSPKCSRSNLFARKIESKHFEFQYDGKTHRCTQMIDFSFRIFMRFMLLLYQSRDRGSRCMHRSVETWPFIFAHIVRTQRNCKGPVLCVIRCCLCLLKPINIGRTPEFHQKPPPTARLRFDFGKVMQQPKRRSGWGAGSGRSEKEKCSYLKNRTGPIFQKRKEGIHCESKMFVE